LVDAPPLVSCAFIFFVRVESAEAHAIRDTVLKKWSIAGMNIKNFNVPVIVANPNVAGNIKGALMNGFKQATSALKQRCQMLICVVDGDKRLYEQIKTICLCEAGVMSQCMLQKHVGRAEAIKDQYIANVALKANIKLGGTTNTIDTLPSKQYPDTMFIGIDVTHPAPGSAAPSIAAIVSSYDKEATKYNTYVRAQGHRVEIIQDMGAVATQALYDYKKKAGKFPTRVIVYRDGVASGQFEQVREYEVKAIKKAAENLKTKIQLSVIVVQKRHHVRLFPTNERETDRSGNCVPGTTIDRGITHPIEFNFYLQSHSGIQGTSRPTLYHVIHDDSKMSSDQVQKLSYDLCFLSERATRSISFPSPAYRAHLAAFYARMFIDGEDISESASVVSGQTVSASLRPFVAGIEHQMYYM
jgi:eukaryotic translation initiation factor 2C